MNDQYILKKTLEWSTFYRGFAIPVEIQPILSLHLTNGSLAHGEKRSIKIILNQITHVVTLTSVNFDRKKYPDHSDIWQIIYGNNSSIAKDMRKIFSQSFKLFEKNRQNNNVILPKIEREYFVLYTTNLKDTFYLEPIFNDEILNSKFEFDEPTLENLFNLSHLTDSEAKMVEKYSLTKVRKLNRSIGNYLKQLYDYRCQICGEDIGRVYDTQVMECHHIDYFIKSLNNDISNLIIVCPNHHRIIHSTNPIFNRERIFYCYPNGYKESLKLNFHL